MISPRRAVPLAVNEINNHAGAAAIMISQRQTLLGVREQVAPKIQDDELFDSGIDVVTQHVQRVHQEGEQQATDLPRTSAGWSGFSRLGQASLPSTPPRDAFPTRDPPVSGAAKARAALPRPPEA